MVNTRYLRGINLVAREIDGAKQYYLFNAHGDVLHRVDETANVLKTYKYDAFGNEENPEPLDTNPFRYCGEYFDKETGEIYLRARNYDPRTGRFTTEDTTTSLSGRSVAYVYTSTNPVLGKTHYLLTVLPKNEEFELQPANAYAAPKEFRIEWGDAYSDKGGWEGWENIDSLDVYVMGCEVPDQYKCRNFVRNVQLGFSD